MAVIPETAPAPASGAPRWRRFLTPWRSPADQPAWARPTLLAIAAAAAVAYGWGMAGASVEPFYGAAARSMSESWHDFIFAAFDPAGTVTVDKLPGALWVQALSLRIFGFHILGALILPQVVEGVLTVLVLYRAVRRLAGPVAGLTAAAVLAVTPITVLLSRGNVSDSLLILLLVLAADATSAALATGSLRQLLLGAWVGLAFQAKMIQAWLALPALAAAYLLAAPAARLRTRCAHGGAGRAGHHRGLAVLDDRGLAGPVPEPALRGRQSRTTRCTRRSSTTTAWVGSPGTGRPSPGRLHRS